MDEQARGGPRPGDDNERAGLSPARAFFLLGAVLAAVTVGFLATRESTPATEPAPARSPDYTLTDEEALAEFDRLNAQLMQAYEDRNIALAEEVFTSDSPMLPRVRQEIDKLLRSNVLSRTTFHEEATKVSVASSSNVILERTEILAPKFVTEGGGDATGSSKRERRVVRWELRQDRGRWLLHNGTVVSREVLPEERK